MSGESLYNSGGGSGVVGYGKERTHSSASSMADSAVEELEAASERRSCQVFVLPKLAIPVRLHFLFFVHLLVGTLSGFLDGPKSALLAFLVLGPILLLSVLLHELGHLWAARRIGATVRLLVLWPAGGLAACTDAPIGRKRVMVALAGPATHVLQGFFWWLLGIMSYHGKTLFHFAADNSSDDFWRNMCFGALFLQILLFMLNLFVPAHPLDGGFLFMSVLLSRGTNVNQAAKLSVIVSFVVSLGLLGWGIALLAMKVFMGTMVVCVALWVLFQDWRLWQFASSGTALLHPMCATAAAGMEGVDDSFPSREASSDAPYSHYHGDVF